MKQTRVQGLVVAGEILQRLVNRHNRTVGVELNKVERRLTVLRAKRELAGDEMDKKVEAINLKIRELTKHFEEIERADVEA